ncbi:MULTISPECIES: hypothetical protein [Acidiphilium]|uniref:hypothetical protein n=1 Tax=Acidiphilium TaxID=522 RepID=UPI0011158479|nr:MULTISPECIES: hypothetical protein [Acidiphilium]
MRDSDVPGAILHFATSHKPKSEGMIGIAFTGCDYYVTIVWIFLHFRRKAAARNKEVSVFTKKNILA